jgi:hypothetical protein
VEPRRGRKMVPSVQAVQVREQAQSGDRSRSPGEHQEAGRAVRRLHGATHVGESLEARKVADADGVRFL